jgi:acyl-CoA synthetase (AMP-forming)/AMP-acid ligase II
VAVAFEEPAIFLAAAWAARSLNAVVALISASRSAVEREPSAIGRCLVDCQCDVGLLDPLHAALLDADVRAAGANIFVLSSDGSMTRHLRGARRTRVDHPEGAAIICYTSGTERMKKGVILSGDTLAHVMEGGHKLNDYSPAETFLACLPLTHMFGFNHTSSALRAGAKVVVSPEFTWMGAVMTALTEHRVTCACAVPFQLTRLVQDGEFSSLTHLKRMWFGGAHVVTKDIERALELLPGLRIGNIYGLTEALRTTVLWPDDVPTMLPSIGKPMPGVEVQLRDEDGRVLADDARGIAWIRGPNLMMGYWQRPQETRAVLSDGWFCTNDMVRRSADGYLWVEGRAREVLHCGGEKLSPEVLEGYIAASCPVSGVAILGIRTTTDLDEIVAFVVCRAGARVTVDDVQRACERHVHSGFVPKRVFCVDGLPYKQEGKLDRAALRKRFENATLEVSS